MNLDDPDIAAPNRYGRGSKPHTPTPGEHPQFDQSLTAVDVLLFLTIWLGVNGPLAAHIP